MVLLLNQLPERYEVFAPLLGCTLLRLDLGERRARLRNIIRTGDYHEYLRDRRADRPPEVAREFPDYQTFQQAFRSSGLLKPINWSEIKPLLQEAQTSDPARGEAI